MATHSSILALEAPWTEKPGGLQDGKRVGHDLVTRQQQITSNTAALILYDFFFGLSIILYEAISAFVCSYVKSLNISFIGNDFLTFYITYV